MNAPQPPVKKAAAGKTKKSTGLPNLLGGSSEANRWTIAILEVLAGLRTPTEAAQSLNVSLVRYYQLETRALEGMVRALEPRPKGKQMSLGSRLKQLEKQLQAARHECARQQALVRVTQRSLGLKPPAPPVPPKAYVKGAKQRRQRRPTVRALKAIRALEKNVRSEDPAAVQPSHTTVANEASPARDQALSQGGQNHDTTRT